MAEISFYELMVLAARRKRAEEGAFEEMARNLTECAKENQNLKEWEKRAKRHIEMIVYDLNRLAGRRDDLSDEDPPRLTAKEIRAELVRMIEGLERETL